MHEVPWIGESYYDVERLLLRLRVVAFALALALVGDVLLALAVIGDVLLALALAVIGDVLLAVGGALALANVVALALANVVALALANVVALALANVVALALANVVACILTLSAVARVPVVVASDVQSAVVDTPASVVDMQVAVDILVAFDMRVSVFVLFLQ